MIRTFRDALIALNPPWLGRGLLLRVMYACGIQIDAFGDALYAGMLSRFPGKYSPESLGLIGNERRIRRGLFESDENYADRLRYWFRDHHSRGGPYAMLQQLYLHYYPNNFPIRLVYASGRTFELDDGTGEITITDVPFVPPGDPSLWARWWLFYSTNDYVSPTPTQIADLKTIPREWNAAHALGYIFVMGSGADTWSSTTAGATWDDPSDWSSAAGPTVIEVG